MNEIVKKILLAMGLTQVQIDDLLKETPEGKHEDFLLTISEHQKKLLKNDADFVGEIEKATKGRVLGEIDSLVKKTFGITVEEAKEKSTKELIALGQTKALAKSGATTQQLQQEIVELTGKIKDYEEIKIPKIMGEVENHKKAINVNHKLTEMIGGFEFSVAKPAAKTAFLAHVESLYDLSMDDKGELVVKMKGTEMLPKSSDGSKLLGIKEIAENTFKDWGFLKQSNGGNPQGVPPGKTFVREDGQPTKKTSEGVSKAEENLRTGMPAQKQ